MGTLARYRKAGGFLQLVSLLEGLDEKKRDQLLTLIQEEDSRWYNAVKSKILTFERIIQWPDPQLMDILHQVKPLTIGTALCGLPEDQIERLRSLLPSTSRLEVKDVLTYDSPAPAKVHSARLQVAQQVRRLIVDGDLALKKFAPDLVIPDDIEEHLASSPVKSAPQKAPAAPNHEPAPDLRTRDQLLTQTQKLEAENKLLQQQVQKLTQEIEHLRGHGRQAA